MWGGHRAWRGFVLRWGGLKLGRLVTFWSSECKKKRDETVGECLKEATRMRKVRMVIEIRKLNHWGVSKRMRKGVGGR